MKYAVLLSVLFALGMVACHEGQPAPQTKQGKSQKDATKQHKEGEKGEKDAPSVNEKPLIQGEK